MKQFLLIITFISSNICWAQLSKGHLRIIEKQSIRIPDGTLILRGANCYLKDTVWFVDGKLNEPDSIGAGRFTAYVELGMIMDSNITGSMQFPGTGDNLLAHHLTNLYCSKYEVSNWEYRWFLSIMKQQDSLNYQNYLPDVSIWTKTVPGLGLAYSQNYHHHPLYLDYPVVNIRQDQAIAYCNWLTESYNSSPNRKYKKVLFRLPTETEWIYCYLGGKPESEVTFNGSFRDKKLLFTANFSLVKPEYSLAINPHQKLDSNQHGLGMIDGMYVLGWNLTASALKSTDAQISAPVYSLAPNGFGLYNMAGNVAEFVDETGFTKGGGWNNTGFYLMPMHRDTYFTNTYSAGVDRGFRWVMEIIEQ